MYLELLWLLGLLGYFIRVSVITYSAATHLKTIGLQAFFQVRGLGDDPGLTRTTDDAFYIRAKYIDA